MTDKPTACTEPPWGFGPRLCPAEVEILVDSGSRAPDCSLVSRESQLMRTAFYDCPSCPHYRGDGMCLCVRAADMKPWWSRWFFQWLDGRRKVDLPYPFGNGPFS